MLGDGRARAAETLQGDICLPQCVAREIFPGAGPAVVEKHGLAGIEDRGDGLDPAGTQLCLDGFEQRVIGFWGLWCGLGQAQLRQYGARGSCQHTVFAGDLLGEFVERSGIHDGTTTGTRATGCLRDRHTVASSHLLHGGVNQFVDFCLGAG